MRARCAIADGVTNHHGHETMLATIYAARTHATAGRNARDDQRVDADGSQGRRKRRAEERTRILLRDDCLTW